MYHSSDPRAALAAEPVTLAPSPTRFAGTEYAKFYDMPPAEEKAGVRNWYARGQNFIIAYSEGTKGAVLERAEQPDEYVVLLPDPGVGAEIAWGDQRVTVAGHSISFVPAGSVTLLGPAKLVRIMTTRSKDLASLCSNAQSYGPVARGYPRTLRIAIDRRDPAGRDSHLAGHGHGSQPSRRRLLPAKTGFLGHAGLGFERRRISAAASQYHQQLKGTDHG